MVYLKKLERTKNVVSNSNKTNPFQVRLDDETKKQLEYIANEDNRSMSNIVTTLIKQKYNEIKRKETP